MTHQYSEYGTLTHSFIAVRWHKTYHVWLAKKVKKLTLNRLCLEKIALWLFHWLKISKCHSVIWKLTLVSHKIILNWDWLNTIYTIVTFVYDNVRCFTFLHTTTGQPTTFAFGQGCLSSDICPGQRFLHWIDIGRLKYLYPYLDNSDFFVNAQFTKHIIWFLDGDITCDNYN